MTIPNPSFLKRFPFAAALSLAAAGAHAQAYTPPPPNLTTGPCVATKAEPCDTAPPKAPPAKAPASNFPFPGDNPDGAAPPPPTAPEPDSPAPAAPQTPTGPASNFPFPGEAAESTSSSSSSNSNDPADAQPGDPAADGAAGIASEKKPALKDAGSTGSTRFSRRKIIAPEDLDHRELEDLEIARYYMSTGSYNAAYKRAQDALKLYPDDENAHFTIAAAADKLDKKPEAIAEYHAYLAAAPDGEKAKIARHALELLEPGTTAKK